MEQGQVMTVKTDSSEAAAVIYLRVSSKEQAEKGGEAEGISIPAQREGWESARPQVCRR